MDTDLRYRPGWLIGVLAREFDRKTRNLWWNAWMLWAGRCFSRVSASFPGCFCALAIFGQACVGFGWVIGDFPEAVNDND